MSMRVYLPGAAFPLVLSIGALLSACGGSDVPPAPPGAPINPPQENTALAAMLAETPSTPPPTTSAAPPASASAVSPAASGAASAGPTSKPPKPANPPPPKDPKAPPAKKPAN